MDTLSFSTPTGSRSGSPEPGSPSGTPSGGRLRGIHKSPTKKSPKKKSPKKSCGFTPSPGCFSTVSNSDGLTTVTWRSCEGTSGIRNKYQKKTGMPLISQKELDMKVKTLRVMPNYVRHEQTSSMFLDRYTVLEVTAYFSQSFIHEDEGLVRVMGLADALFANTTVSIQDIRGMYLEALGTLNEKLKLLGYSFQADLKPENTLAVMKDGVIVDLMLVDITTCERSRSFEEFYENNGTAEWSYFKGMNYERTILAMLTWIAAPYRKVKEHVETDGSGTIWDKINQIPNDDPEIVRIRDILHSHESS